MTHLSPIIAPSLLSANFARLGDEARAVIEAGANILHFDIMDNHYVPNLTMGPMFCEALRNDGIKSFFDVHLMIDPIDALIPRFAKAGASRITFHPKATPDVTRSLALIKENNCETGLALNPDEPLELITPYLDSLDYVLIMSVFPGFGGQAFIPEILPKIQLLRELLDRQKLSHVRIGIDGGITLDNIKAAHEHGADTFIAGSLIFSEDNYDQIIKQVKKRVAETPNTS
jgi:ribulose-phosphate 3-epimerase